MAHKGALKLNLGLSDDEDEDVQTPAVVSKGRGVVSKSSKGNAAHRKEESISDLLSSRDSATMFGSNPKAPQRRKASTFGVSSFGSSGLGGDPLDLLSQEIAQRSSSGTARPVEEDIDEEERRFQLELQKELGLVGIEQESESKLNTESELATGPDADTSRRSASPVRSESEFDQSLEDIMGDILADDPKPAKTESAHVAAKPRSDSSFVKDEFAAYELKRSTTDISDGERRDPQPIVEAPFDVELKVAAKPKRVLGKAKAKTSAVTPKNAPVPDEQAKPETFAARFNEAPLPDEASLQRDGSLMPAVPVTRAIPVGPEVPSKLTESSPQEDKDYDSDWDSEPAASNSAEEGVPETPPKDTAIGTSPVEKDSEQISDVPLVANSSFVSEKGLLETVKTEALAVTPSPSDNANIERNPTLTAEQRPPSPARSESFDQSLEDLMGDILDDETKPPKKEPARVSSKPMTDSSFATDEASARELAAPAGDTADDKREAPPMVEARFDVELKVAAKPKRQFGKAKAKPAAAAPSETSLSLEASPECDSQGITAALASQTIPKIDAEVISKIDGPSVPTVPATEPIPKIDAEVPPRGDELMSSKGNDEDSDWDSEVASSKNAEEHVAEGLIEDDAPLKAQVFSGEVASEQAPDVAHNGSKVEKEHMDQSEEAQSLLIGSKQTDVDPYSVAGKEHLGQPKDAPLDGAPSPGSPADADMRRSPSADEPFDVELKVAAKPKRQFGKAKAKPCADEAPPESDAPQILAVPANEPTLEIDSEVLPRDTDLMTSKDNDNDDDSDWDSEEASVRSAEQQVPEALLEEGKPSRSSTLAVEEGLEQTLDVAHVGSKAPVSDACSITEQEHLEPSEDPPLDISKADAGMKPIPGTDEPFDVELKVAVKPKRQLGQANARPSIAAPITTSQSVGEASNSDNISSSAVPETQPTPGTGSEVLPKVKEQIANASNTYSPDEPPSESNVLATQAVLGTQPSAQMGAEIPLKEHDPMASKDDEDDDDWDSPASSPKNVEGALAAVGASPQRVIESQTVEGVMSSGDRHVEVRGDEATSELPADDNKSVSGRGKVSLIEETRQDILAPEAGHHEPILAPDTEEQSGAIGSMAKHDDVRTSAHLNDDDDDGSAWDSPGPSPKSDAIVMENSDCALTEQSAANIKASDAKSLLDGNEDAKPSPSASVCAAQLPTTQQAEEAEELAQEAKAVNEPEQAEPSSKKVHAAAAEYDAPQGFPSKHEALPLEEQGSNSPRGYADDSDWDSQPPSPNGSKHDGGKAADLATHARGDTNAMDQECHHGTAYMHESSHARKVGKGEWGMGSNQSGKSGEREPCESAFADVAEASHGQAPASHVNVQLKESDQQCVVDPDGGGDTPCDAQEIGSQDEQEPGHPKYELEMDVNETQNCFAMDAPKFHSQGDGPSAAALEAGVAGEETNWKQPRCDEAGGNNPIEHADAGPCSLMSDLSCGPDPTIASNHKQLPKTAQEQAPAAPGEVVSEDTKGIAKPSSTNIPSDPECSAVNHEQLHNMNESKTRATSALAASEDTKSLAKPAPTNIADDSESVTRRALLQMSGSLPPTMEKCEPKDQRLSENEPQRMDPVVAKVPGQNSSMLNVHHMPGTQEAEPMPRVMETSTEDEVLTDDFQGYSKAIAKLLSKGNDDAQQQILSFLEHCKRGPCADEPQTVEITPFVLSSSGCSTDDFDQICIKLRVQRHTGLFRIHCHSVCQTFTKAFHEQRSSLLDVVDDSAKKDTRRPEYGPSIGFRRPSACPSPIVTDFEEYGGHDPRYGSTSMPSVPGKPKVEISQGKTVRISWEGPSDDPEITGYSVLVCDESCWYYDSLTGALFTEIELADPVPPVITSVLLTDVRENVRFTTQIASISQFGLGKYSARSDEFILEAPAVPVAPTVRVLDSSSVRVSLPAVHGVPSVIGYIVALLDGSFNYYDSETGTITHDYKCIRPVPAGTESLVVHGLTSGTEYRAAAAAMNEIGWSAYSTPSEVVVIREPSRPTPPNVQGLDDGSIQISWKIEENGAPLISSAISVAIEHWPVMYYDFCSGELKMDAADANPVPIAMNSVTLKRVSAGVKYAARVAALNTVGWSRYSKFSDGVSIEAPKAPDPPVVDIVSSTSISVRWDLAQNVPAVIGYAVAVQDKQLRYYDSCTRCLSGEAPGLRPIHADRTSIVIHQLTPGAKYRAKVAARNVVGWSGYSSYSEIVELVPPSQLAPPHVEIVDSKTIRVSWEEPLGAWKVTRFAIAVHDAREGRLKYYDSANECLTSAYDKACPISGDRRSAVITDVQTGVEYRAKVSVGNNAGWAKYSQFSKRIQILAPDVPLQPVVRLIDQTTIRVSWAPVLHVPAVTAYVLEVRGSIARFYDSSSKALVEELNDATPVPGEVTSVVVNHICSGVDFQVRIAAINAAGMGQYSICSDVIRFESDATESTLRVDLLPCAPCPRTLKTSRYAALVMSFDPVAEEVSDDRIERVIRQALRRRQIRSRGFNHSDSSGQEHLVLERYLTLRRGGMSAAESLASVWIGEDDLRGSFLFLEINRVLLSDMEDQLSDWAPLIDILRRQITQPEHAPVNEVIVWRGSKLTREQADSLQCGQIVCPPMFVAATTNRCLAEVFRDVYLVEIRIPAASKAVGLVQKRSGATELILTPYVPLKVVEFGLDDVIKVNLLDSVECMTEQSCGRSFPI